MDVEVPVPNLVVKPVHGLAAISRWSSRGFETWFTAWAVMMRSSPPCRS